MKKIISFATAVVLVLSIALIPSAALSNIPCTYKSFLSLGGRYITYKEYAHEFTLEDFEEVNAAAQYYGGTPIAPPSRLYNCHSYSWSKEYQYSLAWIEDISGFLLDGHTEQISDPVPGCIAVYVDGNGEITHSASVVSIFNNGGFYAYSKWGVLGIYYHDPLAVPSNYLGQGGTILYFIRDLSHDIVYTNLTQTHHTESCSKCSNHSVTSAHSLSYSNKTSTQHTATCSVCSHSFTTSHTCTYANRNSAFHTKRCTVCGYNATEAHVYSSFGQCIYCGRSNT